MISFLSNWAEQIVLAVITATIIELILPKNKNTKYIKMIIGIYILFYIISPVIKNKEEVFSGEYNIEKYDTNSEYELDQTSMDERLEKIYLDELEEKSTKKFEEVGFSVKKCKIDAVLDTNKKNAGIHLITIEIEEPVNEELLNNTIAELAQEYEIQKDKIKIIFK